MLEEIILTKTDLRKYAHSVTSQFGEDGIIEEIFNIIPKSHQNHWCIEFGAWDGKFMSNTWNLIQHKNWSGVLVEGSKQKFNDLKNTYKGNSKVELINRLVDFEGKNSLESILAETPLPLDFDVMSMDIDGNDYHVWNSLSYFNPKLVIIEFNCEISNHIDFVQPADMSKLQGSSLLSLIKLGKRKGYELICTTRGNAFFIKQEYFDLFAIDDNSIDVIHKEGINVSPSIFATFDGKVIMTKELRFNQPLKLTQESLQVFPRSLQFDDESESGRIKKLIKYIFIRCWRINDRVKKLFWKL
ncbi:MAG TPA: hypothetical protein VJY62_00590, partial [Bacteroidia bacterium]|nr:hypothetical protein [Bacteroidia bacterium]